MANIVIEKAKKGLRIVKVLTTIWAYITTLFFIYNGYSLYKADNKTAAIIIFVIAGLYLIFVTISLVLGTKVDRTKEEKEKYKGVNFVIKILKLATAVASVLLLATGSDLKTYLKVLNIVWLLITIGLEVWLFILKKAVKSLLKVAKNIVTGNKGK